MDAYRQGGFNNFTVEELLRPFEQTANLCRMRYCAPFVIYGAHRLETEDIEQHADAYREFLDHYVTPPAITV